MQGNIATKTLVKENEKTLGEVSGNANLKKETRDKRLFLFKR